MTPADFKENIQDDNFRQRLKAYLEDIIKEDLDDFKEKHASENSSTPSSFSTSQKTSQDNIYATLRSINLTSDGQKEPQPVLRVTPIKGQQSPTVPGCASTIPFGSQSRHQPLRTPTRDQSTSDMNISNDNNCNLCPDCLFAPNPSSPNFSSRFRRDVVQLVETGNKHKHCDTCYKYCNKHRGDKKICRLRMPRKVVEDSTIDPETGQISMRRSDPWINNFNEYIISACRSNMDIKFIWTGSDAKALVYYITDYVTKQSLSFHDTLSLVQKCITSNMNPSDSTNKQNAIETSRKLVLRCYNALASQQELSGVQVASYLMNWNDHYTTHKFQGLYLIQTERYLQAQLNEIRSKQKLTVLTEHITQEDVYDDDDETTNDKATNDENNDEEHFQIQSTDHDKNYVLVNTRIDYQYRSDVLNDMCLYDFVSILYKKKMNATDLKYLSTDIESQEIDVD
ncbi:unnamed protein product [Adineta steineri]|uniref:Uncharacterized protein n=1 Tax=Adineta steineri TaxID=433720 RepID=A0A814C981_9BILA|nr:unnamed protein product [Adineta steineri]